MDNLQKKVLAELDKIIDQAPDCDMQTEMQNWVETHYKVLVEHGSEIEGVVPRLLVANAICQFQQNFMIGANVSKHVQFLLQLATACGYDKLMKNLANEERMQQMAKILEQKSLAIMLEGREGKRPTK